MNQLQFVIDMNLSIEWSEWVSREGFDAVHWSTFGAPESDDVEIMAWARSNHRVVFTHDLDFGTMLALSHAEGPSVIQVRGRDVLPEDIGSTIRTAINQHQTELKSGALIVIDPGKLRVRILPLESSR